MADTKYTEAREAAAEALEMVRVGAILDTFAALVADSDPPDFVINNDEIRKAVESLGVPFAAVALVVSHSVATTTTVQVRDILELEAHPAIRRLVMERTVEGED